MKLYKVPNHRASKIQVVESSSPPSVCSVCCGTPVVVRGHTTHWYECQKCGKACDTQNG